MIFTALYIALTALSAIVRKMLGFTHPPALLMFWSTAIAILFFHAVQGRRLCMTYRRAWNCKRLFAVTWVTITVIWIGSFLIPVYFGPSIQVFSFVAVTSLHGSWSLWRRRASGLRAVRCLGISLIVLLFYASYYAQYAHSEWLLLLGWTWLTGAAGYAYFHNSSALQQRGFRASEILALRFWMLLLIAALMSLRGNAWRQFDSSLLLDAGIVAIISLIIPIYCAQKSIEKIGPDLHSIGIALSPMMTLIFENLLWHSERFGKDVVLAFALTLAIALPALVARLRPLVRRTGKALTDYGGS